MNKNDKAWQALDAKYNVIKKTEDNFFVELSANQLKEFREPRLMSKFDYKSHLPEIFKKNNLSILPNSRGSYVIGKFNTFSDFIENPNIEVMSFLMPSYIESIDVDNITSESIAINTAYISGILNDFIGDKELVLAINGRMSSSKFDFEVYADKNKKGVKINVEKAQIEIDAGFEGHNFLSLIEAKNIISDDFQIRQIYYPYRLFKGLINKPIRNIFLTYSNGIFHMREYMFENDKILNSIKLLREKKYDIVNFTLNLELIEELIRDVGEVKEPEIAFPQADSFERVINLCEQLKQKSLLSRESITDNYDFNKRQTSYYTDACRYLNLVEKHTENKEIVYKLTTTGEDIFSVSLEKRKVELVKTILQHSVFKKVLIRYLENSTRPDLDEVVSIMKKKSLFNIVQESTYRRRASTVLSWTDWILKQTNI